MTVILNEHAGPQLPVPKSLPAPESLPVPEGDRSVPLGLLAHILLALPLATFFLFVGWHKTYSPLPDLVRYHAWTVWLPATFGRLVGISEMVSAAGLLAGLLPSWRKAGWWSGLALLANQAVAVLVHLTHHEVASLPQNGILIAWLAVHSAALRVLVNRNLSGRTLS